MQPGEGGEGYGQRARCGERCPNKPNVDSRLGSASSHDVYCIFPVLEVLQLNIGNTNMLECIELH